MQDCCCRKHSLAYPFVIFFPTSSSLVNNADLLKERAATQDWHNSHAYPQTTTFLFAELKPIYLPSQFHLKASCFRNLAWSAQQPRSPSRELFLLLRRRTRGQVYRLPAPLYRPRMPKATRAILRAPSRPQQQQAPPHPHGTPLPTPARPRDSPAASGRKLRTVLPWRGCSLGSPDGSWGRGAAARPPRLPLYWS